MAQAKIADDAKENLSDAELKAAKSNPPGSTEHSGAAPGVKVSDEPDGPTFSEPKSAERSREKATKDADEVRDLQWESQKLNWTNSKEQPVEVAFADAPEKGEPESLTFAASDGGVTVYASAREMRFSRDEALGLQRAMTKVSRATL